MSINKILIASNNPGKVTEIQALVKQYNIECISLIGKDIEEPEETGLTFLENAILKAKYYGEIFNLPALADDSGLCIDALDGFPGVISAKIAGPNKDYFSAFAIIKEKLNDINLESSSAHFICSLALWTPDELLVDFEGKLNGRISFPAKGINGFGYDSVFTADGYNKTLADLSSAEKNSISHRKIAFDKFIAYLQTYAIL